MPNWIQKTNRAGLRCWWNGDVCIVRYAKRAYWTYTLGSKGVQGRHLTLEEAQAVHP